MYGSSKRRPASAVAHRCSFDYWITRTRCSASPKLGHGAPVFTSDLHDQHVCCEHTRCPSPSDPAFPISDHSLRVLRPIPPASVGNKPSFRPTGCWPVRNRGDGSHVHFPAVRQGRRPTMPPQHRHGYTAGIHRDLPTSGINQPRSSPPNIAGWVRVAARPRSASIQPLGLLRSFRSLVPHVRLSVSLAGPGPSGGAVRPVVVRAAYHPPLCPKGFRLPSASLCPLRQAQDGGLPPPHG